MEFLSNYDQLSEFFYSCFLKQIETYDSTNC